MLEERYFDAPGSTIEFRTSVSNGDVYLTQTARGQGADLITLVGIKALNLSEEAWRAQQAALQEEVRATYGK